MGDFPSEPRNFDDEWEFDDRLPPQPGWYATLHCWDPMEATFAKATEWLGDRWTDSRPYVAFQGPFPDEDAAERWADEHDPER